MHAENSNPVHSMHTAEMVVCHPMGHISANATYCIVQIACVFECSVVCGSHMLWWRRQPVEVRWGWRRVEGAWWRRLVWNESFHPLGNRAWQERSSLYCLKNQRDWAGDWQITYYLLNHERFCLVMERFPLKPNKARQIRGRRTSLISFVLIKSPCNHFLTRFILHLHPKHSQKHQGKWCKHKWSYCVSCIDMQSMHWYAIHV